MFGQIPICTILFFMLYATAAVIPAIACCYLLLRRGNAFAPDITPPMRLRYWTAALFGSIALGHVWYLPVAEATSNEDISQSMRVGGLLDCMTLLPMAIIVLLCMLQDRRRPLWLVWVMTAPLVAGMAMSIATHSDKYLPVLYGYLLVLAVGLTIYMARALKQYGRWLRDNYADLEHKEVWQSFVVLTVIMLTLIIYVCDLGWQGYIYFVQLCTIGLTFFLLWRVETLRDLSTQQSLSIEEENLVSKGIDQTTTEPTKDEGLSSTTPDIIGPLLQQHCVDTQLYLQHDLTLQQLAQAIGINRYYLSQYFSRQGTTYNAYINGLRIHHFISLYNNAVASHHSFTTKQLAQDSGYRSYSTFSLAFKQLMGQNVTTWMHDSAK